jgi:hypothetical protein
MDAPDVRVVAIRPKTAFLVLGIAVLTGEAMGRRLEDDPRTSLSR